MENVSVLLVLLLYLIAVRLRQFDGVCTLFSAHFDLSVIPLVIPFQK
ncbi:hypothetical protein tloyanaT_22230 [Thalassotalea loyana]|uniref:Uncharacterized protein n=1 Tax=Thalassotalea loyana TaxID=280483 RepID=A0ABQ6HHG8_9GAMM|nr:hypothetical protein tloyanaT_22230 [Thalassotalea loyana]